MKFSRFLLASLLIVLASACSKESTQESATGKDATMQAMYYGFPWYYVMDVRYSRTCSTGGGVCFTNGYGDIFEVTTWSSSTNNPTPNEIDDIHGAEETEELASALVTLGESSTGTYEYTMLLTREEYGDGKVVVPDDIDLSEDFAAEFGYESITLKAGDYDIDYDNYTSFGKVTINCLLDGNSSSSGNVSLN